ncbi:hypothetical protein VSU16_14545 (plasmid) [Cetobacterium somerae]|uniref:hypothetical protein n=1 Tax=Cetobacterium somerae TaxID=188913 RepID=UPI002E7B578D|nr:hypothetical protein [Cetobacterium somerae]WVJ03140.1 hypothetical protein VSU16_14545 [Cetobacterium somerae]
MKAFNKKRKRKHSTKIRRINNIFSLKKIKLKYPNDESLIIKKKKTFFIFKTTKKVVRQIVFKITDSINLSCVSGNGLGHLCSRNYWEIALIKENSLMPSTLTPGLNPKKVEEIIKKLKLLNGEKEILEYMEWE